MTDRIRVLHFTTSAGRSDYFRSLAEGMRGSEFELAFGTLQEEGPIHRTMRQIGVRAFSLAANRRRAYALAMLRLARWLRSERCQVVHTHLYDGCAVGLAAATLARVPVRVLTAHHVVDSLLHRNRKKRRAAFAVDAGVARFLCDRAIAPSQHTERVLRDEYGLAPDRISRIPYGFSAPPQVSPTARARVRAELGLGGSLVFIAVGRLHWVKDLATLFRAFAAVRVELEGAKLLIVGDGSELPGLRQLSQVLRIEDAVVYTGHRSDVPDLLAAADVLVNSSLGEAFNQALMEALAAGLFVVATDVGAVAELLTDTRIGLRVPPSDAAALGAAMRRSRELYSSGAAERRKVADRYPVTAMVREYEALYRRALAGRAVADH